MRRVGFALAVMICAVVFLAPLSVRAAGGGSGAYGVGIVNFAFELPTLTVKAGNPVTWRNLTTNTQHTTTSDNGVWDSGVLNPGQSFTFTFTTPGSYPYHCSIHTFMKGTITVQ